MIKLEHSFIEVSGKESFKFLQGLTTNDLNLLNDNLSNTIYSLILSSNGRYLFDIFIYKINSDIFLLEVSAEDAITLISTLNRYKLIAKINIELNNTWKSYYITDTHKTSLSILNIKIKDPRLDYLGYKIITKEKFEKTTSHSNYLDYLYKQGIPTSNILKKEKTIPIEFGFDELNSISYTKGCYLGQEFTNSAKRKLAIKKRLLLSTISNYNNIEISDGIYQNEIKIGEVVYINEKSQILLNLSLVKFLDSQDLTLKNNKIQLIKPKHTVHYTLES